MLAALAVAASAPAFAQEISDQPVTNAGGHIAVVAGYDGTIASASTGSDKLDGVAYGVKLGHDFNFVNRGLLCVKVALSQSRPPSLIMALAVRLRWAAILTPACGLRSR